MEVGRMLSRSIMVIDNFHSKLHSLSNDNGIN